MEVLAQALNFRDVLVARGAISMETAGELAEGALGLGGECCGPSLPSKTFIMSRRALVVAVPPTWIFPRHGPTVGVSAAAEVQIDGDRETPQHEIISTSITGTLRASVASAAAVSSFPPATAPAIVVFHLPHESVLPTPWHTRQRG